jgi:tetratricopeptide (TPR) repeat protein
MNQTDLLRAELERLFELEELLNLSRDLLGFDPDAIGGTAAKGSFAGALTGYCREQDAIEALCDALLALRPEANPDLTHILSGAFVDSERLEPGSSFGPYAIGRELGEGRAELLYSATSEGKEYRLRVLKSEAARDRRGLHRFLTVNRLIGEIAHPGLPKSTRVALIGGRHVVAHELVDAQTLATRLARTGPLHVGDAKPLLRGLLDALAALHNRRIAHGDLRLESVASYRSEDGSLRVVLLDPGTDRLRVRPRLDNGRTELFATCASPKTAAPELIRGQSSTPRSDVYSFGALAFELMTGRAPFGDKTALDAAFGHLRADPPRASEVAPRGFVPPEFDELLGKLLQKDPDKRPGNAGAVLVLFDQLQRAQSILPPKTGDEVEALIARLLEDPTNEACAIELEAAAEGAPDRIGEAFTTAVHKLESDDVTTQKALLFRAARVYAAREATLPEAEKAYARALELDASDRMASGGLEEIRRRLGKFEEVIEGLLQQSENADSRSERARLLSEIGRVYAHDLKDREQALVAFSQAFAEDPREAPLAAEIERLAGTRTEAWTEVLSSAAHAAESAEMPAEDRVALLLRVARWYVDKLKRPDLALPCYQAVVSLDPASDAALEGMAGIYRKAQQWSELGLVLTRRADASATPARARDLRAEAADILLSHLGDVESARGMYEQILADDPSHERANAALAEIYEKSSNHNALLGLLERRAEGQRGDERTKTLCRIAEIHELALGKDDEAERRFRAVLESDPKSLDALRGLDRLLSKAGRFQDLLENLGAQLAAAATPRQKIGILERSAALHEEEFLDHKKAAEAREQILLLDAGNEAALGALARNYRALDRWDEACRVYERHAKAVSEPGRRVALLLQRAKILAEQLERPDAAAAAYEGVLEIDATHPQALEALARLRESEGDADRALAAIDALADKAETAEQKAEQRVRAAKLLESRGNVDAAIARYKQALDANPKHRAAAQALRNAYVQKGDATAAVQLLEHELEHAEGDLAKGRLAGEAARLLHRELKDDRRAEEAGKRALKLDPTNLDALLVLGDLAFEGERYLEAAKHLEIVAGRAESLEKVEATRVLLRYLDALTRAESGDQALAPVETLLKIAHDDISVLGRVAELVFERGSPARAAELYQALLERAGSTLDNETRGRASFRRGESLRRAGKASEALAPLSEAAELAPHSTEPLVALAQAYEALERWDDAIRTKTRHLDLAVGDERVKLLVEIGEIAASKLNDRTQAAKSFVAALDERPDDRRLLTKLMQLYSEEKDWNKLVEVVLRLADFVEDPKQRVKYLHTAAIVTARQIGDSKRALEFYDQVLALDPRFERALAEAIELRSDSNDHAGVETLLRQKIELASKSDDQAAMLSAFTALGELYENKLGALDKAVDAYEAAQTLDPENRDRAEKLSALYATNPERYLEKAVATQATLLRQNPYRHESYKTLRRLYTETRRADAAWCLCQALAVLELADPDEERFYARMRSDTAAPAQAVLSDDEWLSLLMHEDADPLLTAVFALIEPAVLAKRGQSLEELGFDSSYLLEVDQHPAPLCQSLFYAGGVLGISLPPVFQNPNDQGGLGFLFAREPCMTFGATGLREDVPLRPAAFIAAQKLAYLRPGSYVRHILASGTALKSWLFAAIKLTAPQFPVAAEVEGAVNDAMAALGAGIQGQARDQLTRVVAKLIQSGTSLDLKRWVGAIDLTADRAGFLLCHDLETAVEVIRASDPDASVLSREERTKELVLFSVSAAYFELRKRLGISVDA